ncbi:NAD(P)-binding domain-containing protein [Sporolactobacillus kofuensis]|uniref:NAD(P)-binding domain-containing protein n=1 Tax=Sporolactobacillus kofuensis TaxID=269672 RepID=A0ABW1WDT3_9BACL|nr:NAD(P)/FAD-dependent oxidoreductase [Sporolactobacillus kofuensis]MCO7175023.1 NAD(P)/FAD-dependent oxidoreductase [Sporolactobacillus kofuensis]
MSLDALNERVKQDLSYLVMNSPDWVRPVNHPDGHVYDAVIVGGGQCGLGIAFGLMRERISNILVIDENEEGLEGPWVTYARMVTLRTPKQLTPLDFGIPSLTFRSWWEAQFGQESWAALDKIPRGDWMNYLRWYRHVLDLPVMNKVKLNLIEPIKDGIYRLHVGGTHAPSDTLLARKVILATGIQGGGSWYIPPMITDKLPKNLYAHTSEAIDFDRLNGKKIAVLGGGASAFDNAHFALSKGASEVHVFVRRPALPRVNPIRQLEPSGLIEHFHLLTDAEKYAVMAHFFKLNQPPTNDMFARASAWPGFHLHLGSPWLDVARTEDTAKVTTAKDSFSFDFLIVSTGLRTDPALRPELRLVEKYIARWSDCYNAPEEIKNQLLDAHPYLSPGFGLLSRDEEGKELLHGLFAFNYSAMISCGLSASALSGMKYSLPKIAKAVASALFLDNRHDYLSSYFTYQEPEFISNQ